MKIIKHIILLVIVSFTFSCITHKKLKSFDTNRYSFEEKENEFINDYKLVPGDILNVKVSSPDENSVKIFNKGELGTNILTDMGQFLNGYLIDDKGSIELPIIGQINILNLTIPEAKDSLLSKIQEYYKQVNIDVKLINFRVTILGEVTRPNTYIIYNDRATITDILAKAGDVTDYGNRNKIKIIRTINNKRKILQINIQDPNFVNKPEYFLLPNDVIYIEPLKAKVFKSNITTVSLFVSTLSMILIIYNTFNK